VHDRLRPVEPVDDRVLRERSAGFRGGEGFWQPRVAAIHGYATSLSLAGGAHWRVRRASAEAWPGSPWRLLVPVAPRPIYSPIPEPLRHYTCQSYAGDAVLSNLWTAWIARPETVIIARGHKMTRKVPSWHKTCQSQNKCVAGLRIRLMICIIYWIGHVRFASRGASFMRVCANGP